jgi:hypothetical protein
LEVILDNKEFYAVFVQSSYYVEGDERSRTNPGHGYPAHTVSYTDVIRFKDEAELKAWIERNNSSYGAKPFEAVVCRPLKVKTSLSIEVE